MKCISEDHQEHVLKSFWIRTPLIIGMTGKKKITGEEKLHIIDADYRKLRVAKLPYIGKSHKILYRHDSIKLHNIERVNVLLGVICRLVIIILFCVIQHSTSAAHCESQHTDNC